MNCLAVAIAFLFIGGWVFVLALCRISAIADTYQLHPGKPPEDWE
jgi:hypothetical protein